MAQLVGVSPVHQRWRVWFPVRAHTEVADLTPVQHACRRQPIGVSLSFSQRKCRTLCGSWLGPRTLHWDRDCPRVRVHVGMNSINLSPSLEVKDSLFSCAWASKCHYMTVFGERLYCHREEFRHLGGWGELSQSWSWCGQGSQRTGEVFSRLCVDSGWPGFTILSDQYPT